ncbi:Tol biopolymer transport system, TolR protein [hydrothermal vent metagenome]|uniref:Tol biopolymer transport system, TolR protein n=1 Tax=hydrothermal vent metagenome TaxID=652676 RepID=A0A1W1CI73_9ZZZZ
MNLFVKNRKRYYRSKAEINVVPYIDVMLVLLVIFMMTTPVLEQGVEVDLPAANSQQLDFTNEQPVVVSVDKKGRYFINIGDKRKNLDANIIIARVAAAISLNPKIQVMVKGDKDVAYGKVVELMSYLKQAGVEKVGFVTQSPDLK